MNPRLACLFVQLLALTSVGIDAAAADYPVSRSADVADVRRRA